MNVLLQARMSSTRLPGKALLPVGGLPSIVLAAYRAANCGGKVRVITSTDATDDVLTGVCRSHGLDVYRGALDDVLARTVGALATQPDNAIAVRLTGDNLLPDQALIEAVVARLKKRDLDYVGIRWPDDGLPYGLSVEAFRVSALRCAHASTANALDREHTTPWLRRHCRAESWPVLASMDLSRLRCTIDTFDDYILMQRVFSAVPDPVSAPWEDLVYLLGCMPEVPIGTLPRLGYCGDSNNATDGLWISHAVINASASAQLSGSRIITLLRVAIERGITHFLVDVEDGKSAQLVGRALTQGWSSRVGIIGRLPKDISGVNVERDVRRLCHTLGVTVIDALLVPAGRESAVWTAARATKDSGLVRYVGLWGPDSDQSHGDAEIVLDRPPPSGRVPVVGSRGPHRVVVLSGHLLGDSLK